MVRSVGDKIKILCTRCKKSFRVSAASVRPNLQTQCTHCFRMITFDGYVTDSGVRRALADAREMKAKAGGPSAACAYLDNYRVKRTKLL
jgi:hypothetical protein